MTASYSLRMKRSAEKELRALSKAELSKVVARMRLLAADPRPPGSQKMAGESQYRVRQGDYRVLYTIDEMEKVVEIVKIGHRRDVYR